MKIIFLIGVICLVLLIGMFLFYYFNQPKNITSEYQGPVPQGYDEGYFRQTGITKPLENN